jgi:hypothetical protein
MLEHGGERDSSEFPQQPSDQPGVAPSATFSNQPFEIQPDGLLQQDYAANPHSFARASAAHNPYVPDMHSPQRPAIDYHQQQQQQHLQQQQQHWQQLQRQPQPLGSYQFSPNFGHQQPISFPRYDLSHSSLPATPLAPPTFASAPVAMWSQPTPVHMQAWAGTDPNLRRSTDVGQQPSDQTVEFQGCHYYPSAAHSPSPLSTLPEYDAASVRSSRMHAAPAENRTPAASYDAPTSRPDTSPAALQIAQLQRELAVLRASAAASITRSALLRAQASPLFPGRFSDFRHLHFLWVM